MKTKFLLILMALFATTAKAQNEMTVDGVTYTLNMTDRTAALSAYPSDKTNREFSIPESISADNVTYTVNEVKRTVFNINQYLGNISIPKTITSIGEGTFNYCFGLENIYTAEENPTYSSIDGVLYDKAKKILHYCPNRKGGEYSIPEGTTTLGYYAFFGCSKLTKIHIPASLSLIEGGQPFLSCSKLKAFTVSDTNPFFTTEAGILFSKDKTTLYLYPKAKTNESYSVPEGVQSIGNAAFASTRLVSVQLPGSLIHIGDCAFQQSSLTAIRIPDQVTTIGGSAFLFCEELTNVTLPNELEVIDESSFMLCTMLKELKLPEKLKEIKYGAFLQCGLQSVTLPSTLHTIGNLAFADCIELTSISCVAKTPAAISNDSFSDYTIPLKVPTGCKTLYQQAEVWSNFTNITEDEGLSIASILRQDKPVYSDGTLLLPRSGKITVYHTHGQTVYEQYISDGACDLKFLSSGTYIIKYETEGITRSIKISK